MIVGVSVVSEPCWRRMAALANRKADERTARERGGVIFVVSCAVMFVIIAAAAAYFLSRVL